MKTPAADVRTVDFPAFVRREDDPFVIWLPSWFYDHLRGKVAEIEKRIEQRIWAEFGPH